MNARVISGLDHIAYLLPWLFFCGVLLFFFSLLFPSDCYTYLHLSFAETVLSNKALFIEKRGREVWHKVMWRSPSPMRPTQSIMMHLHLTEDSERFFGALAQHCRSPDATNNKRLRKAGAWDERQQVFWRARYLAVMKSLSMGWVRGFLSSFLSFFFFFCFLLGFDVLFAPAVVSTLYQFVAILI
jgi:hypothetical protein